MALWAPGREASPCRASMQWCCSCVLVLDEALRRGEGDGVGHGGIEVGGVVCCALRAARLRSFWSH